eukprot:4029-Heterococcus_DN1.PRE.6
MIRCSYLHDRASMNSACMSPAAYHKDTAAMRPQRKHYWYYMRPRPVQTTTADGAVHACAAGQLQRQ